jgi:hypothetical protein
VFVGWVALTSSVIQGHGFMRQGSERHALAMRRRRKKCMFVDNAFTGDGCDLCSPREQQYVCFLQNVFLTTVEGLKKE